MSSAGVLPRISSGKPASASALPSIALGAKIGDVQGNGRRTDLRACRYAGEVPLEEDRFVLAAPCWVGFIHLNGRGVAEGAGGVSSTILVSAALISVASFFAA